MGAKVAAGIVKFLCEVSERRYGISRAELLDAALLEPQDLTDPSARLPEDALSDVLRFVVERTGDAALGLRLAEDFELRTQGFWGYALLSSMTVREWIETYVRYLRLRGTAELALTTAGDRAVVELTPNRLPPEVMPVLLDLIAAIACRQLRSLLRGRLHELELWLSCPERPHHRELRAMVSGPVIFNAPCNRAEMPLQALDLRLAGDPHLAELARAQLDVQLTETRELERGGLLEEVRGRLRERLGGDVSLERIARDLRLSARTLRRRLDALGASYQGLMEDTRRASAIAYLLETEETVHHIAARLGYGDPSNFRRAFRRWLGVGPATFRAERRVQREARSPARDARTDAQTDRSRRLRSSLV